MSVAESTTSNLDLPRGVAITGRPLPGWERVLTRDALEFVAGLHRSFDSERKRLLARREEVQARYDAGELPDFVAETKDIREGDWKVAPIPADLQDRRVEITGPAERKMIVGTTWVLGRIMHPDSTAAVGALWSLRQVAGAPLELNAQAPFGRGE